MARKLHESAKEEDYPCRAIIPVLIGYRRVSGSNRMVSPAGNQSRPDGLTALSFTTSRRRL
jgi:hypothetical protein